MGCHRLEGNPPIDVKLRRSARSKRLSLRVSRLDGQVTLTMPQLAPLSAAVDFLHTRETWLRAQLSRLAPVTDVAIGSSVPFAGRALPVRAATGRRAALHDDHIAVPADGAVGARVKALLKTQARDALVAASDHYAGLLGQRYARISLRDTRSRWGSCTSDRALMYSWRLVMAPPPVLRYVAAHEVAHLVQMNHSPAFWDVVAEIYPDHRSARDWLRDHADALHRVRFGD